MEAIVLTDQNFAQDFAGANGLLLVHKPGCPNCKALEKVIEKFLLAKPGVTLMQVDSQANPETACSLGAERVPTLCGVKNGKVRATKTGLMNLREMSGFYESAQRA